MSMQGPGRGADQAASSPPPVGPERPVVGTSGSTASGAPPTMPGMAHGDASSMRQQGGQGASGVKEEVGQAFDEMAARAAPVVDQAQEKAGEVFDQARAQATTLLEVQKERAVDGLDAVIHAAHQTGQQLREDGQETVARYADQAAQGAERLAGYLRGHEVGAMVDDAEDFARRQPQLFLAAGLALGLVAARFLKSSARYRNGQPNAGAAMARTGAYGGNLGPGSGQVGMGGQYRPANTSTPPSYANPVSRTPAVGGGMSTGTHAPYAPQAAPTPYTPQATPTPYTPPRTPTDGGMEPGRRA